MIVSIIPNLMNTAMHTIPFFRRSMLLLVLSVTMIAAPCARAHAVVTAHTLQEQPVKPGHPTVVALFFNSTIEFSLSKVQLVSGNDVHQTMPIKAGKKRGELLIELPALDAGNYALKYKVFAADGHLTDDVLRFRVAP